MPEDRGIYPKYVVFKHPEYEPTWIEAQTFSISGPTFPGEQGDKLDLVEEFIFVLKPGSDRHARVAMAAYAQSVMEDKPLLGEELMQIVADGPRK